MEEHEYEELTRDEMQRFVDQQMRDGASWREALAMLTEVIGIRPATVD